MKFRDRKQNEALVERAVGTNSRKRSIASIEEGEDNQEGDREGAAASSSAASSSSAAADPAPRALEEMYGSHDENEDEEDSDEGDDVYVDIDIDDLDFEAIDDSFDDVRVMINADLDSLMSNDEEEDFI